MPIQTVLYRPVVLLLAYKACYITVNAHGQILVDLHVIPAPLKHVHTVAEKNSYDLAGSPPQTVILTEYSLKSDQPAFPSRKGKMLKHDYPQGDSGGPLVTEEGGSFSQIGVVSWGYGCAQVRIHQPSLHCRR